MVKVQMAPGSIEMEKVPSDATGTGVSEAKVTVEFVCQANSDAPAHCTRERKGHGGGIRDT